MKHFLFLSTMSILIVSCGVESLEIPYKALGVAAKEWGTSNYGVGIKKSVNTSNGSHSTLTLTLIDPTKVDSGLRTYQIASTTAIIFLGEVDSLFLSDFDQIEIIIERDGTLTNHLYKISKLRATNKILSNITEFIQAAHSGHYAETGAFFDNTRIPDSSFNHIGEIIHSIDSINGTLSHITCLGFRYDYFEANREPTIVCFFEICQNNSYNEYAFAISEGSGKILQMAINPD